MVVHGRCGSRIRHLLRRHLSFQEALAAQVLADETVPLGVQAAERFKQIGGSLADFLNMPFYRNMLRIGAGLLGHVFE